MIDMIAIHSMPFALLSVDLIFNTFDFHRRRLWLLLLVGLAYLFVNLAFTLLVGKVYPPID